MNKLKYLFLLTALVFVMVGCQNKDSENGTVIVYNWGEYIDPEVLTLFEDETVGGEIIT